MLTKRLCIFAAVATISVGLGGTIAATALPVNADLLGANTAAPDLQMARYYHRHARRAYRRGYYYGGYGGGYYGGYYRRGYYGGYGGYYRY